MFVVMQKLKDIKAEMKILNKKGFSELHVAEAAAYHGMMEAQKLMHQNPDNEIYADAKLLAVKDYIQKHQIYVEFLKQRAKVEWLKNGDENTSLFHENTSLFHQSIKARRLKIMFIAYVMNMVNG